MPKWLKVVLAVTAGLCLVSSLGVAVAVHWFKNNIGGWTESAKKSAAEGTAFGRRQPSSVCLPEAARRLREKSGFTDELAHKFFLRGCLDAAIEPPDFCSSVPAKSEILKSVGWGLEQCNALGMGQDQACTRLVQSVQEHCHEGKLKFAGQGQATPPPQPD